MKVRDTSYPTPYAPVAPVTPADGAKPGTAGDPGSAPSPAPSPARTPDQATLLGIPRTELTPKVRAAIDRLLEEVRGLRQELEQAKRRVDHLEQLADQDTLTPVLNRRAFVRELSRVMAFTERYGAASAVIYFDVNGLKLINDSHGHAAGDAALSHVAQVLMQQVRGSDMVGRLGGDEFGVILVQAERREAQAKAADLAQAIAAAPVSWNGQMLQVGASYGVQSLTPGQAAQDALDAADRAMYAQKHGTRSPDE